MAIHYYHPERDYFLSTNYKVWFSTLENQNCLYKVGQSDIVRHHFRQVNNAGSPHFLMVRHPVSRLESFFKDKFRRHPASLDPDTVVEWQHCQKIFFPVVGVNHLDCIAACRKKLMSFPFCDFLKSLPEVFLLDGHLQPQSLSRLVRIGSWKYRVHFDRYLKVESSTDRAFLSGELGLDIRIKRNSTENVNCEIRWTDELKAISNNLYVNDFHDFGYEPAI